MSQFNNNNSKEKLKYQRSTPNSVSTGANSWPSYIKTPGNGGLPLKDFTFRSTGQAQADIKQAYIASGQAQAITGGITVGTGQAQADILQTYVEATGQALADIKQVYTALAQALAFITTIALDTYSTQNQGGGGSGSWPHTPINNAPSGVLVIISRTGNTSASAVSYGGVPLTEVPLSPQDISTINGVEAWFLGADLPEGAQTISVTAVGVTAWIAGAFTVLAVQNTEIEDTSIINGGGSGITNPNVSLAISSPSFVAGAIGSGANAVTDITAGSGTSEAIEADWGTNTGSVTFGSTIKTSNFTYGWTIASNTAAAVTVAITASDLFWAGFGQAQGTILQSYTALGQAQGTILRTYVDTTGQSQADILQTYTDAGQTQALIVVGQTLIAVGQAQALINAIYNGYGQSNASIKQTYPLCVGGSESLLGDFILGSSQLGDAGSEGTCIGAFGQAQALILGIGLQVAQAQASIKTFYTQVGQAQSQIKQIYTAHGQANSTIIGIYFGLGQAESYILGYSYGNGQAQADILQTYNQHGQAQAQIYLPAGFGQAQALISALGNTQVGQAQAHIAVLVVSDTFSRMAAYGTGLGTPDIGPDWVDTARTDYTLTGIDGQYQVLAGSNEYDYFVADIRGLVIYDVLIQMDVLYVGALHDWATLLQHYYRQADDIYAYSYVYYNPETGNFEIYSQYYGGNDYAIIPEITPAADVWYTFKVLAHGRDYRAKFWQVGTEEPDWQIESLNTTSILIGGSVETYADLGEGFTPPVAQYYDNYQVYKLAEIASQQLFGNAQAYIHEPSPKRYAQAQARIENTIKQGQAAARIKLVASNTTNVYQDVILAEGPAAYYPLNEALPVDFTDGYAYDVIGSYDLFREYGDTGRGPVGGQVGIPGTTGDTSIINHTAGEDTGFNYLYRYGQSIPITSATNWAVEFWINFETLIAVGGSTPILHIGQTGFTSGALYFARNNTTGILTAYAYNTSNSAVSVGTFVAGNSSWYHIVLTRGTGNILLYVNGSQLASTSVTFGTPSNTVFINEASTSNIDRFYMDELVLYTHQLTESTALAHYFAGLGFNLWIGQAQAFIDKSKGLGQAQAFIVRIDINNPAQAQAKIHRPEGYGQAQGLIVRKEGYGQAKAHIKSTDVGNNGQARAFVISIRRVFGQSKAEVKQSYQIFAQSLAYIAGTRGYGQAQAIIAGGRKHAQAQAYIIQINVNAVAQTKAKIAGILAGHGQAMSYIFNTTGRAYGQAQARSLKLNTKSANARAVIVKPHWVQGQAQGFIWATRLPNGNAQGYILKPQPSAQAQAQILGFGQRRSGQARAKILSPTATNAYGQAQAQIKGGAVGQAAALIFGPTYLVRHNGYYLPGYAQQETIDSVIRMQVNGVNYIDGSLSEYMGLENKLISLHMKTTGPTYLDVKLQAQKAATILHSNRGFTKLYIQYWDRYFEALTKKVSMNKVVGESMRILDYTVEFEAKPWLTSDTVYTISGTGLIDTDIMSRDLTHGGWTPANITVTGTNVTISGYTATGSYAGYISISGAVSNFEIDSYNYTATDNAAMNTPDYIMYVGPGKTYFAITGATETVISWKDRWYL